MHTLEICTVPIIDLSQVIVMPKMWVLQACVYVFLLLGNSFVVSKTQGCDLRHYSLFSLMSQELTLFALFLIFETLFIIFVKFRHYFNELDIICLN